MVEVSISLARRSSIAVVTGIEIEEDAVPILLWLLVVPLSVVILLWLFHVI